MLYFPASDNGTNGVLPAVTYDDNDGISNSKTATVSDTPI